MVKRILFVCLLLCLIVAPAGAKSKSKVGFTGAETCKNCHRKTWRGWNKTKMAKAFDVLLPDQRVEAKQKAGLDPKKDYTTDAKCLKCHTTGFGFPGGFESIEVTPALVGVQCESCHGPGRHCTPIMEIRGRIYELRELIEAGLRPRPLTVCASCHNDESPTLTEAIKTSYDVEKRRLSLHAPPKLQYHQYGEGEKEMLIQDYEESLK